MYFLIFNIANVTVITRNPNNYNVLKLIANMHAEVLLDRPTIYAHVCRSFFPGLTGQLP